MFTATIVSAAADSPDSTDGAPSTLPTCTVNVAPDAMLAVFRVSISRPVCGVNPPPGLLGRNYPCTSTTTSISPARSAVSMVSLPSEPSATCAFIFVDSPLVEL